MKNPIILVIALLLFVVSSTMVAQNFTKQLELKPDKDARLSWWGGGTSTANTNYGSDVYFLSNAWTSGGSVTKSRFIMEMDFSAIPTNATITSYSFTLKNHPSISHSGTNASYFYRVVSTTNRTPWKETTVTWNNQPTYDSVTNVVTLSELSGTSNLVLTSSSFKDMMQGWVNRTNKNYGFIFRLATESVYRRMSFASSDYSVDADKPKLNIEFSSTSPDTLIPQYDNYIVNLNTTYNSEHEDFLGVSNLPNQGNTIIKSLLKFNLSGLPSDILITNAKLKLYRKTSGSMSGKVKLVNSSWNNLVTWATQPTTVDPLIDFSIGSGSAYVEIPLLNLIKYWYDNPSLNYGVMLEANTDNTLDYYSYDYTGDVHKWPELIIEFVSLSATLNPVSDWTILDSDQNCHQTGNLKVGLDNSNGLNRSYIKFDFSSIPTNRVITNAFLYLKATSASNAPVNIVAYPIQDNFSGCTGTAGTTMAGQQRATPNAYINVTSQVTGWNQQSNLYHGLSLDINESVTNRISYFYDYESGTNVPTLLLEHIPTPITQQPASTGDCDAATPSSSYQVVVSSDAQSYQWERNRPSVGTWEVITTPSSEFTINSSPATQSTLSVTQLQTDGTQFRCKVQMPGYFVYTAVASYTIFSRPVTTITADCNTACDDDPVTISASATMNPTFLWSTGETTASIVKNPAISTGYYFTATETVSGHNCSSQSSTQTIDVCSHIYAELNRKTDGGYAITQKGFLQFVYKEEYNSTGITINIYNKDGILLTYTRTVHFGENLLYLKLIGQGLTEGSLYNAEVINGKGEKYYLSFKYSAN